MANYEIWYCDDIGNRIASIATVEKFEYVKVAGDVGVMTMSLPVTGAVWEQVKPDHRIHIYRQPVNGSMALEFVAFLQGFNWTTDKNGLSNFPMAGECPNTLLTRRISAYNSEAAQATLDKSTASQALIAAVSRNLIAATDTARRVDDHLGYTDSSLAIGGAIKKPVAWDKLLEAMQDIQASTKTQGTEIFYGIIPTSDTALSFTTWQDQPGQDRTSTVFSLERGNLVNPSLSYDYSKIKTYIYVGGKGEGASRNIEEVQDTTREGLSYWARRESFRNATYVTIDDTTALNDVGQDELAKFRPKIKLTCTLIDAASTRYGLDWNWGDKVTIDYQGIQASTIIRAVHVKVDSNGKESISTRAEIEL